ncbi:hypothetical protein P3T76_012868 [Phytophthora citrophthora]|uniref:Uncharacterized protein n=1 Tax=Phytophthora citrophthora TaxID=4793 RepID=A0AAD9LDQ4_9STRA|nr:hypothetical protein P3T76_012868 [Phytophthora citrophthora]
MASRSRSSSFSSNALSEQTPVPAAVRLQRAMEAHAALHTRTPQQPATSSCSSAASSHDPTPSVKHDDTTDSKVLTTSSSSSVDDLATQLKNLWQREKDQRDQSDERESHSSSSLTAALQKIGSREKDELVLRLLLQQDTLRTQRSEAADLGEKIAAKLLHQQHELRHKYREQISELETQLHEALHFNPQVAALRAKVEELEESNREHEQKLRFAVQKLQRSRKREKELKMMNDPLWD